MDDGFTNADTSEVGCQEQRRQHQQLQQPRATDLPEEFENVGRVTGPATKILKGLLRGGAEGGDGFDGRGEEGG